MSAPSRLGWLVCGALVATAASARADEFIPDLTTPVALGAQSEFRLQLRQHCTIAIVPMIVFEVTDVAAATPQEGVAELKVEQIVVPSTRHLKVQIAAAADHFVDAANDPTYAASLVSWTHGAVTGGVGVSGHLAGANEFQDILVCNPGGPCTSSALRFTLGADATQSTAGAHTLIGLYRVSSVQ